MICAFFFEAVEGPEAAGGDMSSDEAEEIGRTMTTNDELCLCGLAGDDEDDIAGDAEALLGRAAAERLFNCTMGEFGVAADGNSGTSGDGQANAAGDG
jgi:hypothetical protein